jgi:hypothetical protein
MRSPTRRNRNIGTAKQGHGQNNRMVIPGSFYTSRAYYERIKQFTLDKRHIHGREFTFIVERLRRGCYHTCSVNDLAFLIEHLDPQYFNGLSTIVLRQPKRKEELLSSVWGRLAYEFDFPGVKGAAIILEAFHTKDTLKWPKRLSVQQQYEIKLLADDGHEVEEHPRCYLFKTTPTSTRNHNLHHTFFHELGHFWHYQTQVLLPAVPNEPAEALERREDLYFSIPKREKEVFAITFGLKMRADFEQRGLLPFPPK